VDQNANHHVHQPDQRREGDDSGIIQWFIRLQCSKILRAQFAARAQTMQKEVAFSFLPSDSSDPGF